MKIQIIFIFLIFGIVASCSNGKNPSNEFSNKTSKDKVVGKKILYQQEGKILEADYFLVRNNDTFNLRYNFKQNSKGGIEITMYENDILRNPDLSYREEKEELERILREASDDFTLSSLTKIWDFSLLVTGDLAIAITKQLPTEYLDKPLNNLDIGKFLLTSKLTEDLNELLRPYGKRIQRYVVEKAGFLDSSIIFKHNKIETPKSKIPSKILDAQIWTVIENNGG